MEEHLQSLVASAASFPVAWGPLPSNTTLPRATMQRVSGVRDMNLNSLGTMEARVQIDCFGKTYAEAITASREIRTALEGYRGNVIQGVFLDAIRDGLDDDAGYASRVSLSFVITYTE